MTVQAMPWAIQGQSHPAVNANNVTAAMFGVPVAAFAAAASAVTAGGGHGIIDAIDLAVTQNGTPDMSVNVAAGRAIIRSGGSSSLLQGCYAALNDATVNVSIAASDATNPRIDYIVLQVRDSNYGESAADARLVAITGTPAGVPAAPSLASYPNCVVLAQIAVAAAVTTIVTANITDKRTRANALGGILPCTTANRPTGASLHAGLTIFDLTEGKLFAYSGTAWVEVTCPGAWTAPTFQNSWVNYDGVEPAQYRKVGDIVELRGLVKNGTVGETTAIFTLPTGFRPPKRVRIPIVANSVFAWISVGTDGVVGVGSGSNVWVALDAVAFSTVA